MLNTIKILLVEDQKLMRIGIKALYEENNEQLIFKEAESAREAIDTAKTFKPHVVLMDIGLPDMSGIEAAKRIMADNKKVKVIMLTSHSSAKEVEDALAVGASAYVLKDITAESLMVIVKTINEGAMWLDPQVVPYIRDKNAAVIPARQVTRAAFREQHANLTQREYEVLKLVVDGKSNSEIAKDLTISEHTAKAHVCNIIQKLVVDDRTQAAVKALREGLV